MKLCRATHVFTGRSLALAGGLASTTFAAADVREAASRREGPFVKEATLNSPDTEFASNA